MSYGRRSKSTITMPTSRVILLLLMVVCLIASALYWWRVQHALVPNDNVIAVAYTAIMVLAPPALISFLIPWSPGGMLLQKVNARTVGYPVVIACSIYLAYYSYQIQWSYWAAQPAVAEVGLVNQQMLIGIIGFIIIPALLWTPVSSDELVETVRQAHLVKRYELQTQADMAILRATLLRAQEKALVGFANLTVDEREELAAVMRALIGGIDKTLREFGQTVKTVSGVTVPFDGLLDDNPDIRDVLEYISESLEGSSLKPSDEVRPELGQRTELPPRTFDPYAEPTRSPRVAGGSETKYLDRDAMPSYSDTWSVVFRHPKTGDVVSAPFVRMDGQDYVVRVGDAERLVRRDWVLDERDR